MREGRSQDGYKVRHFLWGFSSKKEEEEEARLHIK
jgi:hypothetical protein